MKRNRSVASAAGSINTILSEFAAQRLIVDPQSLRCRGPALDVVDGEEYQRFLALGDGRADGKPHQRSRPRPGWPLPIPSHDPTKVTCRDHSVACHDDCPFQNVSQLAHVSGPLA